MKAVLAISAVLFLSIGLSAQTVTRSFGSVVFPGGTSATTPGVTRNFGSVVFPGGAAVPTVHSGPATIVGVPHNFARPTTIVPGQNFRRSNNGGRAGRSNTFVYAYPVFVGGSYDNSLVNAEPPMPPAALPPSAMPLPPDAARPVMIQVGPDYPSRAPMSAYQPAAPAQTDEPAPSSERYLIAFKDHTVYSAIAYWFDGDTLHYFTPGNVHNQASVGLIDRELTTRLNRELGIDFHLPK